MFEKLTFLFCFREADSLTQLCNVAMRGRCLLQHLYPSIKVELDHSHAAPFGITMSFLECDEISQFEKVNVQMLTNRWKRYVFWETMHLWVSDSVRGRRAVLLARDLSWATPTWTQKSSMLTKTQLRKVDVSNKTDSQSIPYFDCPPINPTHQLPHRLPVTPFIFFPFDLFLATVSEAFFCRGQWFGSQMFSTRTNSLPDFAFICRKAELPNVKKFCIQVWKIFTF